MKVLKIIVIVLLVLGGLYAAWMATLPATYTLERTAVIDAKPAKVYNTVVDMKTWKNWSYWDQMDSTNEVSYFGETGEVGSGYSWKGEQTGEGTLTIADLQENERIDYSLLFVGMGENDGYFTFQEEGENQTEVTYAFVADFGFFDRIGKYFIDGALGTAFDESLADLKDYLEEMPDSEEMAYEMNTTIVEPMGYYGIKDEVSFEEVTSDFFGERYGEIMAYIGDDAANNMTGSPFVIYEKWDEENEMATIIVALPINSEKAGNDRVIKAMTYGGEALMTIHTGPYEEIGSAHEAIYSHVEANNLMMAGSPWEVYVTDPGTEPDPAKWVTEIYYPVAAAENNEMAESTENSEASKM